MYNIEIKLEEAQLNNNDSTPEVPQDIGIPIV